MTTTQFHLFIVGSGPTTLSPIFDKGSILTPPGRGANCSNVCLAAGLDGIFLGHSFRGGYAKKPQARRSLSV